MGAQYRLSSLSLAVLLAFPLPAAALGLGEIVTDSHLGEGLRAEIPLFLGKGERLESNCFRLIKPETDLPWLKTAQFSVEGKTLLLRTQQLIVEPLVQLEIQVTCNTDLRRRYTLMLPAPVAGMAAAPTARSTQASSPAASTPRNGRLIRAGETPASIAAALYPASVATQDRFVNALIRSNRKLGLSLDAGPHQALPEGETLIIPRLPPAVPARPKAVAKPETPVVPAQTQSVQATLPAVKPGSGDRLVVAEGAGDLAGRQADVPGVPPAESVEAMRLKLAHLERQIQILQDLQAQAAQLPPEERLKMLESALGADGRPQESTASQPPVPAQETAAPKPLEPVPSKTQAAQEIPEKPRAKLQPQEEGGGIWYWLLGALAAAGLGGLGWREWQRRQEEGRDDYLDYPAAAPVRPVGKAASAADRELDEPMAPRPVIPAKPVAKAEPREQAEAPLPSIRASESLDDTSVDEIFSHNPVMELADIMLSFGRVKGAAQALQEFIDQNPREALQPWIKLLDVYRQADMRPEFENLAKNLNQHFNVELIKWEDAPSFQTKQGLALEMEAPKEGVVIQLPKAASLEEMPHIRDRIMAIWGTPACLELVENLLRDNRSGERQGFPLGVVDDLLFLSDVLKDEIYHQPLAPEIKLG